MTKSQFRSPFPVCWSSVLPGLQSSYLAGQTMWRDQAERRLQPLPPSYR